MQESPIERLKKQFEILSSQGNSYFIKEYIEPEISKNTITLKNDVKQNLDERSLKAQKYFNNCQQYLAFFKSKSFQFLFVDYSLGRLVYEFDDEGFLVSYNMYWCPCPLSKEYICEIEKSGLDVSEFIENIDNKEKLELNSINLRSPIRFDYTRDYKGGNIELHPYFHMHFQDKDTRAETKNIFSLYSYMLFVLENCYPTIYGNKMFEENIQSLKKLDSDTINWQKVKKNNKINNIGEKIYTRIEFTHKVH